MSYWDWKTLHVVMAAILAVGFVWALLPVKELLLGHRTGGGDSGTLSALVKRQLLCVLPLAVSQVGLGMATLFSEPIHYPASYTGLLMLGTALLGMVWLVGLIFVKKRSEEGSGLDLQRLRHLVFYWLSALALILLVMLYFMVNLKSLY